MDTGIIVQIVGWGLVVLTILFVVGVMVRALCMDKKTAKVVITVIAFVMGIITAFVGFLIFLIPPA